MPAYENMMLQITLAAVPVALYFLVLGLLNSRQHPQLLSGRMDFTLLIMALAPLVVFPLLSHFGASLPTSAGVMIVLSALVLALSPQRTWVIYNIPGRDSVGILSKALSLLNLEHEISGNCIDIPSRGVRLEVGSFAPLRNVTVRLKGGDEQIAQDIGLSIANVLSGIRVPTSNMAMSLLLVATAMMVAPLAMVAHRVPEIVRIIGDLLN